VLIAFINHISSSFPVGRAAPSEVFLKHKDTYESVANALGQTQTKDMVMSRIPSVSQWMLNTFMTLSANVDAPIDNGPARYILHRYFMQTRRWSILKWEATATDVYSANNRPMYEVLDTLPGMSHVVPVFEAHYAACGGYFLRDLALVAAIVETSEFFESVRMLQEAYEQHDATLDSILDWNGVSLVLTEYTRHFFNYFSLPRYRTLPNFIWKAALAAHGPTLKKETSTFTYSMVESMIEPLQYQYPLWQDEDCLEMKDRLISLEDKTDTGRVPVRIFNNHDQHGQHRFGETINDLLKTGSIDTSGPEPRVIISNYITGALMCAITAWDMFTFCCIRECDGLMLKFEETVGKPSATPDQIIHFAETAGTSTVTVPRRLPESLITRVQEMAAKDSYGKIPIHSRLFAQFLHHAYPRECAFPSLDYSWAPTNSSTILHNFRSVSTKHMEESLNEFMDGYSAQGDGGISWEDVDMQIVPADPKTKKMYVHSVLLFLSACGTGILLIQKLMNLRSFTLLAGMERTKIRNL